MKPMVEMWLEPTGWLASIQFDGIFIVIFLVIVLLSPRFALTFSNTLSNYVYTIM